MKLLDVPTDLPIESVNHVIKILKILTETIKEQSAFTAANSIADYQETIMCLKRDLLHYAVLYEEWQKEPNATDFQPSLDKMQSYLTKADCLLQATPVTAIH